MRHSPEDSPRNFLDVCPDGVLVCSTTGRITEWNSSATQMLGWTLGQCLGREPAEFLVAAKDRNDFNQCLQSAVSDSAKSKAASPQSFELLRSSGDAISAQITFDQLEIAGVPHAIAFIRSSPSTTSTLIHRSAASFSANTADTPAVVPTVNSNGAVVMHGNEFLANVTHELRTPMNAIIGMTELALDEGVSDVVRDYLLTAKDSADTMLSLINDILDYSRLDVGREELEVASFDVRRLLEETLRSLSLRAHERGLELAAVIDPDVPFRIYGDPARLRQLLSNLISNAIKFTERGEVVVGIRLDQTGNDVEDSRDWKVGDTAHLHFTVKDTGIGIDAADHSQIFAPFVQVDSSMTRSYAGTGLGLSICSQLASLMDGTIRVESALGHGSTFHFTAGFDVAPASNEPQTSVRQLPNQLAGTRVLIVDDNESTRRILQEMVASWGMNASIADGVESAIVKMKLASTQQNEFQLLIVDAIMPKRDGIDFLRQLQEANDQSGLSVLMMSRADQRLFRKRIAGLHVNAFLEKPVSQSGLLNSITEAIEGAAIDRNRNMSIEKSSYSLKVLVAEDIPANQKVVTAILSRRGHEPAIANNGREAIDLFERHDFDVILMDVQMPILDGIQATRAIRDIEKNSGRRIPVVAMTAHAMPGDREACMAAGMDYYLSKPLDAQLLLKTIEHLKQPRVPTSELLNSFITKSGFWRLKQDKPGSNHPTKGEARVPKTSKPLELWKPDVASHRMGGDIALLSSMVDYFLEDSPKLLSELQHQLEVGNSTEAARVAHSLKGLCSNFEAAEATQAGLEIETACMSGKLNEAEQLLLSLSEKFANLSYELTEWQSQQSNAG